MPDTLRWLTYQVEEDGRIRTYRVDLPPGTPTAVVGVQAKVMAGNWKLAPGPGPAQAAWEELKVVEGTAVLAGETRGALQPESPEAESAWPAMQEVEARDSETQSRAVRDVCYYQGGHWYCWDQK